MNTYLLVALLLSSSTAFAKETKIDPTWSWGEKMRKMEVILSDPLIDATSEERYNSDKGKTRVEENATALYQTAKELSEHHREAPEKDPSIEMIAKLFAAESKTALSQFKNGNPSYARTLFQSMTSYCIACHTRTDRGPHYTSNWQAAKVVALRPFEQAQYFAATRQFDLSVKTLDEIISNTKEAEKNPFEWEKAVRTSLGVLVRVNNDPAAVIKLTESILKNPKSPEFVREQATEWKSAALKWKAEPAKKLKTAAQYMKEADRLMKNAKARQTYPADRSADVEYLRATAALHEALNLDPKNTKAHYQAGIAYEVLRPLRLWEIQEYYYLSCIYLSPGSDLARKCYSRYEESVYFSYTGSIGTNIPEDIQERLSELKTLSKTKPGKSKLN